MKPGFNKAKRVGRKRSSARKMGKYISQGDEVRFAHASPTACFVTVGAFSSHPHYEIMLK